jgi:ketosteroid isomerase-like protein
MVNMGLSIEDRLDIVELINRYNTLADERDVEGTLTCYTEDGQITGDFGTGEGKAAMREDLPAIFEAEGTLKRHLAVNHQLSGDGEIAEARYVLAVLEGESIPSVGATAIITDELQKVDGEWLVRRHNVDIDLAMYAAMEQ